MRQIQAATEPNRPALGVLNSTNTGLTRHNSRQSRTKANRSDTGAMPRRMDTAAILMPSRAAISSSRKPGLEISVT
jgi:hypothetical protein